MCVHNVFEIAAGERSVRQWERNGWVVFLDCKHMKVHGQRWAPRREQVQADTQLVFLGQRQQEQRSPVLLEVQEAA